MIDTAEYDTLREEYERNDYDNSLVSALNAVSDEERDLIILYIANNRKTSETARYLCQPRHIVYERLMQARQHIIQQYAGILKGKEETDYLIEYYTKKHQKPKRPVIQAKLYEWTPIARYDSIEEAAHATNGNAEKIMNVCNGHNFKYLGTRWFWESEWEKQKTARSKKTHR